MGLFGAFVAVLGGVGFLSSLVVAIVDDRRDRPTGPTLVVAGLFAALAVIGLLLIYLWFDTYTF